MSDRRKELLDLLLSRGRLRVGELAERFGVTGMTVRRDLAALEGKGLLTRTHGGCVLRAPRVRELPFGRKQRLNRPAKEAIARAVAARLADGASVYLDTGTTCAAVASLLPGRRRGLKVFTNNLAAAMALFDADGIETIVLGGVLGRHSPDLSGELAVERLRDLRLDVAVVGADALDLPTGTFYAADLPTGALSRAAQQQARQVYLCIDASKFGKQALAVAGRLSGGVTLFTDRPLGRAGARRGAKVVVARPDD